MFYSFLLREPCPRSLCLVRKNLFNLKQARLGVVSDCLCIELIELNWNFLDSVQQNKVSTYLIKWNKGVLGILLFQYILKSRSFASTVYKQRISMEPHKLFIDSRFSWKIHIHWNTWYQPIGSAKVTEPNLTIP